MGCKGKESAVAETFLQRCLVPVGGWNGEHPHLVKMLRVSSQECDRNYVGRKAQPDHWSSILPEKPVGSRGKGPVKSAKAPRSRGKSQSLIHIGWEGILGFSGIQLNLWKTPNPLQGS